MLLVLHLLEKAVDEEFLGALASITYFCIKTEVQAYIDMAETVEDFAPPHGDFS